jgi:two-component system LytT family response regulator
MIKTIIIDDEVHCLDSLGKLLFDYCPDVQVVERCLSARQGIAAIQKHQPELIFLDFEMSLMNGLEILEQRKDIPFAVIYTTSYDQHATAIRFSGFDNLLKPIDPKQLVAAVHKVQVQKHPPATEQFQLLIDQARHKEKSFTRIAVPTSDGFELIAADQLVRCEADNNYCQLFLKDKKRITACRTLKEMDEQLYHFSFFFRVHHSCIVNLNEVTRYVRGNGGYLVMSDGSTVKVSRSHKEALFKIFLSSV